MEHSSPPPPDHRFHDRSHIHVARVYPSPSSISPTGRAGTRPPRTAPEAGTRPGPTQHPRWGAGRKGLFPKSPGLHPPREQSTSLRAKAPWEFGPEDAPPSREREPPDPALAQANASSRPRTGSQADLPPDTEGGVTHHPPFSGGPPPITPRPGDASRHAHGPAIAGSRGQDYACLFFGGESSEVSRALFSAAASDATDIISVSASPESPCPSGRGTAGGVYPAELSGRGRVAGSGFFPIFPVFLPLLLAPAPPPEEGGLGGTGGHLSEPGGWSEERPRTTQIGQCG